MQHTRASNALSRFWAGHPARPDMIEGESIGAWSKRVVAAFEALAPEVKEDLQSEADEINKLNQKLQKAPHSEYVRAK